MQQVQSLLPQTNSPLQGNTQPLQVKNNTNSDTPLKTTAYFTGRLATKTSFCVFTAPIALLALATGGIAGAVGAGVGLVGGSIYKAIQQRRGKHVKPVLHYTKNIAKKAFYAGGAVGVVLGVGSYLANIPLTLAWGAISLSVGTISSVAVAPMIYLCSRHAFADIPTDKAMAVSYNALRQNEEKLANEQNSERSDTDMADVSLEGVPWNHANSSKVV